MTQDRENDPEISLIETLPDRSDPTMPASKRFPYMLGSISVDRYQQTFIHAMKRADDRSAAWITRMGIDLLILYLYQHRPALWQKILANMSEEARADFETNISRLDLQEINDNHTPGLSQSNPGQ